MDATVVVEHDGRVLRLGLDRPDRKNALDPAAIAVLIDAIENAATDDTLRAIVLAGRGGDFCSGADWVASNTTSAPGASTARPSTSPGPTSVTEASATDASATAPRRPRAGSVQRRTALQAHRLIQLITEVQLPVVCSVRGHAAGLGFQLALAADFTVAADTSRFWEPFTERGFSADSGASWLLPRLVGIARAKELLLLGRRLTGAEAADWGLIHRAVPEAELEKATEDVVDRLADGPTVALGLTKRSINRGLTLGLADTMETEAVALELSSRTADFKEGLAAFRERRRPHFGGR